MKTMNNLIVLKRKLALLSVLLTASFVYSQEKYTESFNVNNDVLVVVNTSFTNVIFETWNKDIVEVEAYISGESLSEQEKKRIFKEWKFDVLGNSKKIVITSNIENSWNNFTYSGNNMNYVMPPNALKALEGLHTMPAIANLEDLNFNIEIPEVPELAKLPTWPFGSQQPTVISSGGNMNYSSHNSINFDSNKYKKNKQAYVNELNKQYNAKATVAEVDAWLEEVDEWSENIEKVMGEWGENFGNEFANKFGPEFEKKMEKWGEEYGKEMEKWGEQFGKDMEKWGEEMEKEAEKWSEEYENNFNYNYNDDEAHSKSKSNRTIIIRIPKGTKTEIDVRHGELKMADAYNVRATLNYSKLTANSIDGGKTLIIASYAPVTVNNWQNGELALKFVEDCQINNVNNIVLTANSSNVLMNKIHSNAKVSGSFGDLIIKSVSNDFDRITLVLENSDAELILPTSAFTFSFSGKKSPLRYPKSLQLSNSKKNDRVLVTGFNKSQSSGKAITVTADYSELKMQ